jgi:hypothetical protein
MQTPSFPLIQSRYKSIIHRSARQSTGEGYFDTHQVGAIFRGLFLSSILWALIAITIYTVYTMIVGSH